MGTTTSWLNLIGVIVLSDERELAADAPNLLALGLVARAQDFSGASLAARALAPRRFLADRLRESVDFEQQQRPGAGRRQRSHVQVRRDGFERIAVDQLDGRRDHARLDDVADRLRRVRDRRERRAERGLHRRLRHEPQDDSGNDGERALGSDEQVRQVVADDVLDDLAAGFDDVAVGQHRLRDPARTASWCRI